MDILKVNLSRSKNSEVTQDANELSQVQIPNQDNCTI